MKNDWQIDIETIQQEVKRRWLRDRKSWRYRIADSVPYWIIIVAVVFFALSAQHTIEVFNRISPLAGYLAPVGVEFGLLFTSASRRIARTRGGRLTWTLMSLEVLLFLSAILVNGAGSFSSVVDAVHLETLSTAEIIDKFGTMPATTQVSLIVAAMSAFIIPIGTLVAGEEVARLMLEHERNADEIEESRWREVEREYLYKAVWQRFYDATGDARHAKREATQAVAGYLGQRVSSGSSRPSSLSIASNVSRVSKAGQYGQTRTSVRAYLLENPHVLDMSVRAATENINAAGIDASRGTVHAVMQELQSVDAE